MAMVKIQFKTHGTDKAIEKKNIAKFHLCYYQQKFGILEYHSTCICDIRLLIGTCR